MGLPLLPYFAYFRSAGSDKTACKCRLLLSMAAPGCDKYMGKSSKFPKS